MTDLPTYQQSATKLSFKFFTVYLSEQRTYITKLEPDTYLSKFEKDKSRKLLDDDFDIELEKDYLFREDVKSFRDFISEDGDEDRLTEVIGFTCLIDKHNKDIILYNKPYYHHFKYAEEEQDKLSVMQSDMKDALDKIRKLEDMIEKMKFEHQSTAYNLDIKSILKRGGKDLPEFISNYASEIISYNRLSDIYLCTRYIEHKGSNIDGSILDHKDNFHVKIIEIVSKGSIYQYKGFSYIDDFYCLIYYLCDILESRCKFEYLTDIYFCYKADPIRGPPLRITTEKTRPEYYYEAIKRLKYFKKKFPNVLVHIIGMTEDGRITFLLNNETYMLNVSDVLELINYTNKP